MCQLVESLRIENKQLQYLDLHNARINNAGRILFGWVNKIDLTDYIQVPTNISDNKYKCRVVTDGKKIEVTIDEYNQRKIETLKIINIKNIDYQFKTTDRVSLDFAFSQKGDCDDVIIVKNGFVTDSWAANILFFDGEKWITPNTPLLKGVQREFLLSEKKIVECTVKSNDIFHFQLIKLVNAMIPFDQSPPIKIATNVNK